jgi:hypothetical protein
MGADFHANDKYAALMSKTGVSRFTVAAESGIKKGCSPLVGRATVEAVTTAAVTFHNYRFGNRFSTGTHH